MYTAMQSEPGAVLGLPFPPANGNGRRRLLVATAQWPPPGRSGDFFEVVDHNDGGSSVFFADVCGNGEDAAPIVRDLRAILHQRRRENLPPRALLAVINEDLEREISPDRFVGAVAARIDPGNGCITVATAGHLGPFIRRRHGQVIRLGGHGGPPLGILPGQQFEETRADLRRGDTVVFATDGITDRFASPGDPVGETGLMVRLERLPASLLQVCRRLLRAATSPTDATVLAMRLTG